MEGQSRKLKERRTRGDEFPRKRGHERERERKRRNETEREGEKD
jgi:hypothetical protein